MNPVRCVLFYFCVFFSLSESFMTPQQSHRINSALNAVVKPSDSSVVGIVGRGFVSVLSAKLAAMEGYNAWLLIPPGQQEIVKLLLNDPAEDPVKNLSLLEATETDKIDSMLGKTDALIIAVDDDSVMDDNVLAYLLNPNISTKLKRIVGMSRNLNGKDMGFFVKASKISANREVWDGSSSSQYKKFEESLKRQAVALGSDYTIARAGTLKGGACGEEPKCHKFLTSKFYEMTKRDIITWQLLFDCSVRGVKLVKGDVLPGPGSKAVFTATSSEACAGDTSRAGIAEAMVKSLALENTANTDFGVGTAESREPPTHEEWREMFTAM